jgi:EpsI family protein
MLDASSIDPGGAASHLLNAKRRALILGGLSLGALLLAEKLKPRQLLANSREGYDYEKLVPMTFGDWNAVSMMQGQIVDPNLADTIERFYTQTVTRAYVESDASLLMLSMAYGEVQNDEMRIHLPEVCYTAQGFSVSSLGERIASIGRRTVPISTAVATLGERREMVSYFVKVGDTLVGRGLKRKLAQMRYSLLGVVPDGLLVRVSSFDQDADVAFNRHLRFFRQFSVSISELGQHAIFGGVQL